MSRTLVLALLILPWCMARPSQSSRLARDQSTSASLRSRIRHRFGWATTRSAPAAAMADSATPCAWMKLRRKSPGATSRCLARRQSDITSQTADQKAAAKARSSGETWSLRPLRRSARLAVLMLLSVKSLVLRFDRLERSISVMPLKPSTVKAR